MAKFKIGDRVRVANIDTDDAKSGARVGSTGRVLDNSVAPWVRMDHKIEIHGATTSLCEYGYGKVFAETQLEFESVTIDQIRDQLAKGYEAIENAKACFDKAKEMLDAKDAKPPRNWPERIEAGDCFEQANGSRYLVCGTKFVNLDTGALWLLGGGPSGNDKIDLSYLGKIDLTIRTDAHEPTGAELVGRRVNCFDTLDRFQFEGACDEYDPSATYPYRIGRAWYFKARLAK